MPDVAASILVAAKKQSQLTHACKLLTNPGRLKAKFIFAYSYQFPTSNISSTALLFTSLRDCQMEKQHSTCSRGCS